MEMVTMKRQTVACFLSSALSLGLRMETAQPNPAQSVTVLYTFKVTYQCRNQHCFHYKLVEGANMEGKKQLPNPYIRKA